MLDLRRADLNLLVVFDALMAERSVTRAAERLGLSQPAASHALARLRILFDDPLLVRSASGRAMEPTHRALAIKPRVASVLADVGTLFAERERFDAGTAQRRFGIRASDLLCELFLSPLMGRLRAEAPGIALDVVHLTPDATVEALLTGEVDLALSTGLAAATGVESRTLAEDRMVALMGARHGAVDANWTLDTFLALPHLRVAMSPTDSRFVDAVLSREGLSRRVVLNVPHWLLVPSILSATDLVATMPERLARALASPAVVIRPLPFATDPFFWRVYWHTRSAGDAGLAWLRELLITASEHPELQGVNGFCVLYTKSGKMPSEEMRCHRSKCSDCGRS